jgi:predicted Zn finger-like uncharacterized protein
MGITTTCPACRGPLRIPDELVGQRVRCPTCQNVFAATTDVPPPDQPVTPLRPAEPEPERPLWKDLNLELDKSDPGEPKKSSPGPDEAPTAPLPPRKPGLVGAVELKLSIDDEPNTPAKPAPRSSAPPAPSPRRPEPPPPSRRPPPPAPRPRDYPDRYDDDEDYRGSRRSFYRRRDTVPHRGTMILVFGIISIVSVFLTCAYIGPLIGIGLGITAWVLGHADLRKIKNQEMDDEGLGTTQAGWICGIIGTILNTLILLACGGFIAFMLSMQSVSQTTAAKPSFAPPPPAMPK